MTSANKIPAQYPLEREATMHLSLNPVRCAFDALRQTTRQAVLRAGMALLATGALLPLAVSSVAGQTGGQPAAPAASSSYPDQTCVATIESRSAPVAADGTFVVPNVPVELGTYRVRVVCQAPDGTLRGSTSAPLTLTPNAQQPLPVLPVHSMAIATEIPPNQLKLLAISGALTTVGSTVQLETQAINPVDASFDATLPSLGTTYSSSNTAIATVDANGVVTATGPGNVTITARNDGLAATIMLSSFAVVDTDGDGMPDSFEIANGLDPYNAADAAFDPDHDGLTNLQEFQLGTNPQVADTDGDGLLDGAEIKLGTNPLVADTDGDGLNDGDEVRIGTNPLVADTDGDGIPDGIEVKLGLNPLVADPTTTVTGHVTNADGTPAEGVNAVVFTYFTALTDPTGAFTLLNVPADLGSVIASAQQVVAGKVLSGSSKAFAPQPAATTDVGTIQLGQTAGQVAGVVTGADGKPVSGGLVTVTSGATTRTTTTDPGGAYTVSGLPPGLIMTSVLDPATSLRGQATGTLAAAGALTLNVRLGSFGTVAGTVRTAAGTPVGAGIVVTITGALNTTATTDTLGHYSFSFVPLGNVTVEATDATGNRGRATGTVTATAENINLDVQYLPRGTVQGTVSDGTGKAFAGATVMLRGGGVFSQSLTTTTNSVGGYSFTGVFAGPVNLTATSTTSSTGGNASTALSTDGQVVTVNISLSPVASLTGTVYHAGGSGTVAGATVTLTNTALTATADASGHYTLPNVPLGVYTVMAVDGATSDRGQATQSLTTAGQSYTTDIVLKGLGTLVVTVKDGAGNLSAGALVKVDTGSPFGLTQNGTTGTDGTATFTQQLAGNLTVTARDPKTNLSGTASVTLAAGQTATVTVNLQTSGTITGTVYKLDGKTPVANLSVVLDGVTTTTTDANGKYTFATVATGSHSAAVLDSVGNRLAYNNNLQLTTQGQVLTANFVIVGRGTVTGHVYAPQGGPASSAGVLLQSLSVGGQQYGSTIDANGVYTVYGVPVGNYIVTASSQAYGGASYGSNTGRLPADGATSTTDIQLSNNIVPSTQNLVDANGLTYTVRGDGALADGAFGVFAGDVNAGGTHEGASLLSFVQNGVETPFAGASLAAVSKDGRELTIAQSGVDGLNVTRRIYVPADGYFARYLEVLANPTSAPISVDLKLADNFAPVRLLTTSSSSNLTTTPPQILLTSSGDTTLNLNDPQNPDRWVTIASPTDVDPFITDARGFAAIGTPPVGEVFDGPGAATTPSTATFAQDPAGNYASLTQQYSALTIPAGGTVALLHFVTQQNVYAAANASAARLVQLPPEALADLTPVDLGEIVNFAIPSGGTSTVAALPALTGQVGGFVYASDTTTRVPLAGVTFQSQDPIFSRVLPGAADQTGRFSFQGSVPGFPIPIEPFTLTATHPLTNLVSPATPGSFNGTDTVAAQDIVFSNAGILTGTVSRGPTVVNTAGTVTIVGGSLSSADNGGKVIASAVSVPIAADGTYLLTGAPAGSYTLTATVTNTLLSGITTATVTVGNTTTANITIGGSGSVAGTVTRPDGSLAVGDQVNLRVPGQNPLAVTVDTGGHYQFNDIPVGTYTIDVYDAQSNAAATATVTVASNATTAQDLMLGSFGTVKGTVRTNDGSSVQGLTVTLQSTTSKGTQQLSATTDAGGSFTFTNVTPGSIALSTTTPAGLQGGATGSLALAGETVTINISLTAAGTLSGTVYQADGKTPAAGINLTLSPAPVTGSAQTTTDANGHYAYANVAFGSFTVYATNPANGDIGQASGQIQANGQARTINITLNGFGNLTVKVQDANGNNVANAAVSLHNQGTGANANGTSNASGQATFTGIAAGTYIVQAKDPVTGLSNETVYTLVANTSPTVTVTLQSVGTITGKVFAVDGTTPVAGITVQAGYYYGYGTTVTTDANGVYTFNNIALGSYKLFATDAAGILRATVSNVSLQSNGQTVTQNITLVGVGQVTGTVRNPDGTVAENQPLVLKSMNASVGGSQNTTTGGDGTYTFAEVPVGKFSVTVQNLPSTLAGFAQGTIASDGDHQTADIQIVSSTIQLPVTLTDADQFTFTVASNGAFVPTGAYAQLSPFYSADVLTLGVNGQGTSTFGDGSSPTTSIQSQSGQQIEINQPSLAGLSVTRKIYVPTDGYFSRRLEVLQNTTSSPITVTPTIGGYERYTKFSPQIVTTANGTKTLDATALWVVDDDDAGSFPYPLTQPALASVAAGTGAPTGLASVTTSGYQYFNSPYTLQTLNFTYQPVTVPANSTVSLLFFTAQESTSATAATAAQRLVQLPAEALAGLSAADLATVVNFVIPTSPLAAVTAPGQGALAGHVYAGDGTTPVPNAVVAAQSTNLLYGGATSATADATGAYNTSAFTADTYSVFATDPATAVQSTASTGKFPVPATGAAAAQDVTFTNTGILQVTVKPTGQTMFTGGTVYLSFPCSGYTRPQFTAAQLAPSVAAAPALSAETLKSIAASAAVATSVAAPQIVYSGNCGFASKTFAADGVTTFLTVPGIHGVGISANVSTPQGGSYSIPNGGTYSVDVAPRQTTQFTFNTPATGSIAGTVSYASGSPAAGLTVYAIPSTGAGTYATTKTDASGAFTFAYLTLDTYTVQATDTSTSNVVAKKVTLAQDQTSTVNLTFVGKATVNVTVHYANGNIGSSSSLYLSTSTTPNFTYAGYTDGNGQATLSNVPSGAFTVRAYYPGQNFYSTTTGSVTTDGQTIALAVTLTPVGTISGTVVNADGSNVGANAYVTVADQVGNYSGYAQTDSAGTYAIYPVPADRLVNVSSALPNNQTGRNFTARVNGVQVPGDGQTLTVNLRYPGTSNVHITVHNADGSTYTGGGYVYLKSNDGQQSYNAQLAADGTATFSNVIEATFVAIVSPSNYTGYNLGSKVFTVVGTDDGKTVEVVVTASPAGTVNGHVYASDGTTIITSNLTVKLVDIDTGTTNYATQSDATGFSFTNVQVGAGGFTLSAAVNNTTASESFTGNITQPGQVVSHDFTLPISSISGHVYLYDGVTPVAGASVYTRQAANQYAQQFYTTTDANGYYQVSGATAGQVVVTAYDANSITATVTATLASDTAVVAGQDIKFPPVGMVVGTVYDNNGNTQPNIGVSVTSSGNSNSFSTYVTTDANGNYTVPDVPIGNISVTAYLNGNTQESNTGVLAHNGDSVQINLGTAPISGAGHVFGTVYDGNQNPAQGAAVTVQSADGSVTVSTTTDSNGLYSVSGLPAGNVTVSAKLQDGSSPTPVTGTITDRAVAIEVDLGLQTVGDVSGKVTDGSGNPVSGIEVDLSSSGDTSTSYSQSSGTDGSYLFGGIAPGTITVQVRDNGQLVGTATGTLPYGGNVTINIVRGQVAGSSMPGPLRLYFTPRSAGKAVARLALPARLILPVSASSTYAMNGARP